MKRRELVKFQSDEYLAQYAKAIAADQKWAESTKGLKTSLKTTTTDTGQSYLLSVENGVTTMQKATSETPAEFSFESTYEGWSKVARGEMDMQSAILKGQVHFKGSLTKLLMHRRTLNRLAELMQEIPKEF